MNALTLPSALARIERELDLAERLEVKSDGSRLLVRTGKATVQRSQSYALGVGAMTAILGIAMLTASAWGWLLVAFGAVICAVVPQFIRATDLFEIDIAAGSLVVPQSTDNKGIALPLEPITRIRAAYDTKGWDGFSTVYAVQEDGSETAVLMLPGTDETLAELTCRTLGLLLDCPATYAGPFGSMKNCFTPSTQTGGMLHGGSLT
jgi:hypothetical protein